MNKKEFLTYCGEQYDKFEDVKGVVIGIVSKKEVGSGMSGTFKVSEISRVCYDMGETLEKAAEIIEKQRNS